MGNQQERSLAWFAGILDGEGSISVQVYNLPDGRVRLTPFVSIVNSDPGIIEGCKEVLKSLGVAVRDCKKPTTVISSLIECRTLRVDGQEPVEKLLLAIKSELRSVKRQYAEKVLLYLASRKERGISRNEKGHIRRCEYSRDEIALIASVRTHKRAKSSEAICQAPNVLG